MLDNYSLTQKTDELRKLILENPDLPIVVLAGEDASIDYWGWTYCSSISFGIDEILDCDYFDYDDRVFTDKERFEEVVRNNLDDEYLTDEAYEAAVKYELEKYEPYWKKVIAIYATN